MKERNKKVFRVPFLRMDANSNMAFDIELFEKAISKDISGFRIYGWNGNCITVGRNQKIPETDLPVVRRPTGGGIVFHSDDIPFTFFITSSCMLWKPSVMEIYKTVSELIKDSLLMAGIQTEHPKEIHPERKEMCFEKAERYDLLKDGKKMMGCAILKRGSSYLVQGTLFAEISPQKLEENLTRVMKKKGYEVCILDI